VLASPCEDAEERRTPQVRYSEVDAVPQSDVGTSDAGYGESEETRPQVLRQIEAVRAAAKPVELVVSHEFAVQVEEVADVASPSADARSQRDLISIIARLEAELQCLRASSTHLMRLYHRDS
jgi:DNA-binding FrmR family transcriptional regulator